VVFKGIFDKFEEYLAAFLMAFMACLAFTNVLSRYLFHYSISFSQELVLNFFVWATFLGASIAFKRGSHVMVTFFVNKFPKSLRRLASVFSLLLSIGLFGLLIYCSIDQIQSEIDLWSTSDALNIPVFWYTLGIPVFSTLIIIRIWQAFRRDQNKGE
jgi:TRAP-type C4-dicarboxylate transport system permease small subunit